VEHSSKVEGLIHEWQHQPGQYAVPWVRVQGRTLSEWMEALHFPVAAPAHALP
jgi:hypothetical protein